jgi:hypothetical protein
MIPMHTPIEKKIYPTASAQTVSGVGCPVPFKYWSIPLSAPSRVKFLKTMIRMKMNGAGTVNHTMYDDVYSLEYSKEACQPNNHGGEECWH